MAANDEPGKMSVRRRTRVGLAAFVSYLLFGAAGVELASSAGRSDALVLGTLAGVLVLCVAVATVAKRTR
jgi:hypothetical protein